MARRESQGLQISLIVFVMLTVILAVTTYVYWSQAENRNRDLEAVRTQNATLQAERDQAVENATKLKVWIGHTADTNMDDIEAQFNSDMQTYAGGLVDVQRTYKDLPAHLLQEMQKRYQTIATLTQRVNQLDDDLNKTRQQLQQEVANARRIQAETEASLRQTRDEFTNERARLNSEKEAIAKQVDDTRTMLADLRSKTTQEIGDLQEDVKQKGMLIADREQKLRQLTTTSFETPDGKISWVNPETGMVYINLGADDGLQPQVTFSVYGVDVNNLAREEKKATIEVTRIVNDHLSEARITEDTLTDPVLAGDVIYTPLWNSKSALHFALAGKMDVNGDGRDDRELVRRLITMNNGTIDAEEYNGEVRGEMTQHTRYLILGDSPTVSDDATVTAEQNAWTKIINQASDLGVEQISYQKLLDLIGYDGEKRTIPLGRWSQPEDFEGPNAEPNASGSVFRDRDPQDRRRRNVPRPVGVGGRPY